MKDSRRTEPREDEDVTLAPISLVRALCLLLLCQLAGECIVLALRLAVPSMAFPGPVVGMVLLFLVLIFRRRADGAVGIVSGSILGNLSLLFVPAAVGIVQHGELIVRSGPALIAALVLSTALTLLVTVYTFIAVARRTGAHLSQEARR